MARAAIVDRLEPRRLLSHVSILPETTVDPSNGLPPDLFAVSDGELYFTRRGASEVGSLWVTDGQSAKRVATGFDTRHDFSRIAPVSGGVVGLAMGRHDVYLGSEAGIRQIGQVPGVHSYLGTVVPVLARRGRMFVHDENFGGSVATVTDGQTVQRMGILPAGWSNMGEYADGVVFTATRPDHAGGVYAYSDGGQLTLIADYNALGGDASHECVGVKNGIVFTVDTGDGRTLWTSDGTPQGTHPLPLSLDSGQSFDDFVTKTLADRALFRVTNKNGDNDLWSTDGTVPGTQRIQQDIQHPVSMVGEVGPLTLFGSAAAGKLFATDGTAGGTRGLADVVPGKSIDTGNGLAYFVGTDTKHGSEVWQTDGTREGTKLVIDLQPGTEGSEPSLYGFVGDALIFRGKFGQDRRWLRLTDDSPPHVPSLSIVGTPGNDRIRVRGTATGGLSISVNGATQNYDSPIDRLTIDAGDGADTITFDETAGAILSFARIIGGNGSDRITTGSGNDTIYGGAGNDTIVSNSGDDWISADAGNDRIESGSGNDVVYGGNGSDRLDGGLGTDRLFGGSGIDIFAAVKRIEVRDANHDIIELA